ncbi:WW domain-binding protein 2-like isoform X1 [Biomphalaria glabrata]|uniref:WW domain-binding protein 2-like isoform X1 n=2 Tax=Biomphalaria glabrata TaxID=6526 RepID=A0A2C9JG04_BIOGL|nr:WW domain-binding protein 2-like isoform X1 [Biomphalaria glabrata]KAI8797264.1 WW domain-binding protein 2 [Biomphalaria glabrata]
MSLNNSHAHGGVLIYAGERILIYYDGIEMTFEGPPSVTQMKGKKKGRIFLTTHRVIFNSLDSKDQMQSFSFPFLLMREVELEQPIFGANYIKGRIIAETMGNWEGEAKFKMHFTHGGAIEFGKAMLHAASLASRNRPTNPPPYQGPPSSNYYAAPPPAYEPPRNSYYSWVPYETFPTAPPADGVYMYQAPPPYPGVDPNLAYPPPSAPMANGHDAKAQEAAASAYYDPSNQHNLYAPAAYGMAPPTYPGPPPAYSEYEKKSN